MKKYKLKDNKTTNLIQKYNSNNLSKFEQEKILKTLTNINDLKNSTYRYNVLLNNNQTQHAKQEKEKIKNLVQNIQDEDVLLKGYISNIKYVWVSEEDSCDDCQELDGTEYDNEDDIPEQLHPNCKCYIDIVYNETPSDEDEECDCVEQIESLIAELEQAIEEVEIFLSKFEEENQNIEQTTNNIQNIIEDFNSILKSIESEYSAHLTDCENNLDDLYEEILEKKEKLENLLQDLQELLEYIITYLQVLFFFSLNFGALQIEAYIFKQEMDKYRHSVANCQSAQLGELGEKIATELSDFKEELDQYKNIYAITHKVSEAQAIADSEKDQIANRLGRERGRNNPTCDCRILMQDLKPEKKNK